MPTLSKSARYLRENEMHDRVIIGLTLIILAMVGCYGWSLQKKEIKQENQVRLEQYFEHHKRIVGMYRRDI